MANEIKEIMTADPNGKKLVQFSEQLATQLVRDDLGTSQIRNIFSEVRRIESMWRSEGQKVAAMRRLVLLKPKMAYQSAREHKINKLVSGLNEAIGYVEQAENNKQQEERFMKFIELFEAILAYHKAKGGRS